jgi:mono/diheme cytochrome c family protein
VHPYRGQRELGQLPALPLRSAWRLALLTVGGVLFVAVGAALTIRAFAPMPRGPLAAARPTVVDATSIPASPPPPPEPDRGEVLFVTNCAECHHARGEKALPHGPPLARRKLSLAAIEKTVARRLPSSPYEDRAAVASYVARLSE